MPQPRRDPDAPLLEELLGYLNFSSGASDPEFLGSLDRLYRQIEGGGPERDDTYLRIRDRLRAHLPALAGTTPAFRDTDQASAVADLVFDHFAPAYREFHRDLLVGQSDAALWRPFFLGRVCEAVLHAGAPWDETGRIVTQARQALDDFIGHRPVAVLRTPRKIEPYEHEWVRPIPLYIRGVGVGTGRYEWLINLALEILRATKGSVTSEAWFDIELLDELAVDPREYDFDHPANKRPNYHFGQWDPHHMDGQGRYRRFVLQQIMLDALSARALTPGNLDPDELRFEAAAVLAGTILMASGTSGSGPDTHGSTTTLGTLVQQIAAYRDAYYEQLLADAAGKHGERLRAEAKSRRQPLAGARQHLNHYLARRRAAQLEHVHLALLFAAMGYAEAARRQADIVPTASARMRCQIGCQIAGARLAIDRGELEQAAAQLLTVDKLLTRAIECGALVDPWNILGFQGQFSLFPAPENSVLDHRVDQLVELMEEIFAVAAQLWRAAALRQATALQSTMARWMGSLAEWWDQFASTTVAAIESFSGADAYESARHVAQALEAWHKAGAASGDIAFWRQHVEEFTSPKAYALVVEALLDAGDLVAALALLVQWLSQAGQLPLEQGEFSFHVLARRWLAKACAPAPGDAARLPRAPSAEAQTLVQKFFDVLEANADDFWLVPSLESPGPRSARRKRAASEDEELPEEDRELFAAAYDEMVYVDSTADGIEADMLEAESAGQKTDYELELEGRRVRERLAFLGTVSQLWKTAALACGSPAAETPLNDDVLGGWLTQANLNHDRLLELLASMDVKTVEPTSASRDALLEYERRRSIKEMLLDTAIGTAVDTVDAQQVLRSLLQPASQPSETGPIDVLCRAVLAGEPEEARRRWHAFLATLEKQPLLYVSLGRGGDPREIVAARGLQPMLRDLARALPKLGLLRETCQLLETARHMEGTHVFAAGAVSEFDRLFEVGYKALVESLVDVSRSWPVSPEDRERGRELADADLVDVLEQLTESLLKQWLAHSRTLRLSVLEKIGDEKAWQALVKFIERYGHDLLLQRFLNLGNLRAILHQGVENWLGRLSEDPEAGDDLLVVRDLDRRLPRAEAAKHLTIIFEAIAENYSEYRDYNSTTTQSDRGEQLYMLLDFLRLRVQYDRIAWHLRPVVLAHEILARAGRSEAAEMWCRAMAERTADVAGALTKRLQELHQKYGMRLPTVDDRLAERFIRPLAIDRVRALVAPAVEDARHARQSESFERLQHETDELTQEPTGVGLDVPGWLHALENEVRKARHNRAGRDPSPGSQWLVDQRPLSMQEIVEQLGDWEREPL
jgi:hypothetical protein